MSERLREYAALAGRHPRLVAGGLRSGAVVGLVSREVWDALSERDQQLLLAVDDCEAGRYDVAAFRRRVYPA